jgi:hypothetical protein
MTRLERRYRLLLRVLPRWYRGEREEEMVSTYLAARHHADPDDEALDLEYGWPGWPEARATAALAVRTRLAATAAPPRVLLLGRTVRLAALLGLLTQSALAAATLVNIVAAMLLHPHDGLSTPTTAGDTTLLLCPVATLALLVRGHPTWAKITAAVAVAPTLISLTNTVTGPTALWPLTAVDLPLWVAVVCLYAGFHREAPTPQAAPWLRAQAVAIGLGMMWAAVARLVGSAPWTWVTIDNTGTVMNWIAIMAGLSGLLLAPRRDPTLHAWAGGLAICAASSLPLQAGSVWFAGQLHSQGTIGIAPLVWAYAQVALLVAVITATATVGFRAWHQASSLPDHS